ncbi:MAG: hypothetical protein PHX54_02740, partial [Lentimicrobiaceae bacterium]|nr:hypothetical protein [Lentimicrobiaceae bacterium]
VFCNFIHFFAKDQIHNSLIPLPAYQDNLVPVLKVRQIYLFNGKLKIFCPQNLYKNVEISWLT